MDSSKPLCFSKNNGNIWEMGARKGHLHSAAHVLQSLLNGNKEAGAHRTTPLANAFERWKLAQNWESLVGEELARCCQPVSFYRGTLFVWVKSAAWMQNLIFMRNEIRKKINTHVGHTWVERISFRQDKPM